MCSDDKSLLANYLNYLESINDSTYRGRSEETDWSSAIEVLLT